MKKKIVTILAIVSVLVLALSACKKIPQVDDNTFDFVKSCFTQIDTAVSSVQTVSVNAGDTCVYSSVTTYTINGDVIVAVTDTTTLNENIEAEQPTTTVHTTDEITAQDYEERVAHDLVLTEDDVENVVEPTETNSQISFDVKADAAIDFLGLNEDEMSTIGTVHVTIKLEQSRIKLYNISYTTANGNTTVISTEYKYA